MESLLEVRYQIPMTVYSRDGKLIGIYGEKKSSPMNIAEIPRQTTQAFLAAEDDRFFEHPGVDYQGLMRAVYEFVRTGEKRQGGSTITMQVARNFFLTSEKTLLRKVKEIMLAMKIESKLPKQQILELYLNKIYFGHHAYGIDAAAQVYYGKHVAELTLGETAMIAGLPKAPSSFNPIANPDRALLRRNYVLRRMLKLEYINEKQFNAAMAEPANASLHFPVVEMDAPFTSEMVRNEMFTRYGEDAYANGYKVTTTLDSHLQTLADKALREALHEYDERHGFRGATRRIDLKQFKTDADWDELLKNIPGEGDLVPGLVVAVKERAADVYTGQNGLLQLDWEGAKWARRFINQDAQGPYPRSMKELLKPGDIIQLRLSAKGEWQLAQKPQIEGAIVAMDAKNGAILAMAGGFDFVRSNFNRVTQAQRQPGSGFKPVLYAAALDAGYTPASIINDAPIVVQDGTNSGGTWRPQNFSGRYYGPTRLREALVKSRNLVSIRLLREIGLDKAIETAKLFGFEDSELPRSLSLALGSGSATPLRMAQAFSVFANGGFHVEPYLIERIETTDGGVVFQASPQVACANCDDETTPANLAPRAITPQVHFMMHSMLLDVVRMGTATKALELKRSDIAGKTGTTNDQKDAWFNGYVPGLVAISWLGFDNPKPLGEGETGGHTALPMWMNFMREALKDVPETTFTLPDDLEQTNISETTGLLVKGKGGDGITEYFPQGQAPKRYAAPVKAKAKRKAKPVDSNGGGSDEDSGGGDGGGSSGKGAEPLF
jgi:penicillin-binding protein 1A